MNKLYIPKLRDTLVLAQDWTAVIYHESRNSTLLDSAGIPFVSMYRTDERSKPSKIVIAAGTPLSVERIYIRTGCGDWDSVTFRIKKVKGRQLHGRFWVRLDNANQIEFES